LSRVVLIGTNSRLSLAIRNQNQNALLVSREIYTAWDQSDELEELISTFKEATIIINKALLDSNIDDKMIYHWNYCFPRFVIETVLKYKSNCRVLTIGSIHESSSINNSYLRSKRKLANYIESKNDARFKHIRLHTIYGEGVPIPTMFIGQIFDAILSNKPFAMSSGLQYRQYHDYFHVAKHILTIVEYWESTKSLINLNGYEWLRLKDMAIAVFDAFDKTELLKIGELSNIENEVTVPPTLEGESFLFPEAIPSIISYLKKTISEES
jgi:hypothetical protein